MHGQRNYFMGFASNHRFIAYILCLYRTNQYRACTRSFIRCNCFVIGGTIDFLYAFWHDFFLLFDGNILVRLTGCTGDEESEKVITVPPTKKTFS